MKIRPVTKPSGTLAPRSSHYGKWYHCVRDRLMEITINQSLFGRSRRSVGRTGRTGRSNPEATPSAWSVRDIRTRYRSDRKLAGSLASPSWKRLPFCINLTFDTVRTMQTTVTTTTTTMARENFSFLAFPGILLAARYDRREFSGTTVGRKEAANPSCVLFIPARKINSILFHLRGKSF